MPLAVDNPQAQVIAWLSDPANYAEVDSVRCVETHGALVFLAGDHVYKIKRAVRYAYMDLSNLDRRKWACEREVTVNRAFAPALYHGVVPITRGEDGRLQLGGVGDPVEWAVHMRRFGDGCLMSEIATRGTLAPEISRAIADTIFESHARAPRALGVSGANQMLTTANDIATGLASETTDAAGANTFATTVLTMAARTATLLDRRAAAGFVRRCHGDLHLDNIVLIDEQPTLFDALEFDERLATIDTLYDLSFLLMDLRVRQQDAAANLILNRYLWRSGALLDLQGLALLPMFLGLRAGIRAMVMRERSVLDREDAQKTAASAARSEAYLSIALRCLDAPPARLVAIGGLSGTGKSTLAMGLAPALGAYPGAVVLRSDLERKALLGVAETDRLPPSGYAAEVTGRVYDRLHERARAALAAGHSVILDAVHAKPEEREAAAAIARDLGVSFDGIWLTTPPDVMLARVTARVADASDANADVVKQQLRYPVGAITWQQIEAGGDRAVVLATARAGLALE